MSVCADGGEGAGGAGAEATAAVVAETAVVEPTLLDAVTATRSVEPTSAVCAV